ncbi:putative short-chain dehydrogenase/reductase [Lepidopterella palustris CBS 459.81]|uniref:Putative short-chain dehydrogenase/reductase n=1 Tax=Lepidopterella palustris CBS 459.81 TaxID=1314670 RepID=A0A8E2E7Q5_9PEZI|nr:putative short-chain dehydrogenase/reductase [Lepidopterella palustris CBS 459.81]
MSLSAKGKRVIVTGGSRGIARAAVQALAKEGANVVIFDIIDDAGKKIAEEATAAWPGTVTYSHVDISKRDDVFQATAAAVATLGGLDSLLNIAGIERRARAEDITEAELDLILNINLKGTVFMNQAVFPHLKENGGSIINFGSDAGLAPYPMGSHYAASKGAVHSFSRTLAVEWGKYNIRVNTVVPAIWTEMYNEFRSRLTAEELMGHDKIMLEKIPLGGKLGDPTRDLAPVILFLVSDGSQFITGQIISVNGGLGNVR